MAPINSKVIALLTTMLEHVQEHPDDSEDTEVMLKSILQAISGTKKSALRRMGESFLDLADERPAIALSCVIFVLSLNPVGLITTIAEQYGWIQPKKVQIEVKQPVTGNYGPVDIETLQHLASWQQTNQGELSVGIGRQIANSSDKRRDSAPAQAIEITTPGGTVVSFSGGDIRASVRAGMPWRTGDSGRSSQGDRRGGSIPGMGTAESSGMPIPRINYRAVH